MSRQFTSIHEPVKSRESVSIVLAEIFSFLNLSYAPLSGNPNPLLIMQYLSQQYKLHKRISERAWLNANYSGDNKAVIINTALLKKDTASMDNLKRIY
jgi:hypothetical protein